MRKSLSVCFVLLLGIALLPPAALAGVRREGEVYIVDGAEGRAPLKDGRKAAREEAGRMARRDALHKVLNEYVPGIVRDYPAARDRVFSRASSLVKGFKATYNREDKKEGVWRVAGTCRVDRGLLDEILGPDVIAMLGNPRVMVLIDERIGDKPAFISTTEGEVLRALKRAGYLTVDPEQARVLLHLDPATTFNDPARLIEAAQTLGADILISGKAEAGVAFSTRVQGVAPLYRVSGTVQLKAILTQTGYHIDSETVPASTGKPVQTVEAGAAQCFRRAASQAAGEVIYQIAYHMASAGSALKGTKVNVRVAGVEYQDVESLAAQLRGFVGGEGNVTLRPFRGGTGEIELTSNRNAWNVASFLSRNGVSVEAATAQTIQGTLKREAASQDSDVPAQLPAVSIRLTVSEVRLSEEGWIIRDALRQTIGESGRIIEEKYDKEEGSMTLIVVQTGDVRPAAELARFLDRPDTRSLGPEFEALKGLRVTGIEVLSMRPDSINIKLQHSFF